MSAAVRNNPTRDRIEALPGEWMPKMAITVPTTGEDLQPTLPNEDRFQASSLPLWDWDYLQHPAVQRPSEMWIAEWAEWGDNMEAD